MADQRHGIAVATLANVNRDSARKPDAYKSTDFINWHESHRSAEQGGILKSDPEAQSILIKQMLFKSSK